MKWYHWTEKIPEQNQWILVYHPESDHLVGTQKYTCPKEIHDYWIANKEERLGSWSWWAAWEDLELPNDPEMALHKKKCEEYWKNL